MDAVESDIVKFFSRHLVPIVFTYRNGSQTQSDVMTTFVLEVKDKWYLITAGHGIRDTNELIASNKYKLIKCNLIDFGGTEAKHFQPIPYTYRPETFVRLSDDYGFDYALTPLSPYYVNLLRNNGIVPLNEKVWKEQPANPELYKMLGVPAQFVDWDSDDSKFVVSLMAVERVWEIPAGFSQVEADLFYGRVTLDDDLDSIKGMSGGPILAFQRYENGQIRYFVIALQSRWLPESHYIAACPITTLGRIIEIAIEMIERGELENGSKDGSE